MKWNEMKWNHFFCVFFAPIINHKNKNWNLFSYIDYLQRELSWTENWNELRTTIQPQHPVKNESIGSRTERTKRKAEYGGRFEDRNQASIRFEKLGASKGRPLQRLLGWDVEGISGLLQYDLFVGAGSEALGIHPWRQNLVVYGDRTCDLEQEGQLISLWTEDHSQGLHQRQRSNQTSALHAERILLRFNQTTWRPTCVLRRQLWNQQEELQDFIWAPLRTEEGQRWYWPHHRKSPQRTLPTFADILPKRWPLCRPWRTRGCLQRRKWWWWETPRTSSQKENHT